MEVIRKNLKSEQGQTVVEYILLLSVAVALVMTFYRSAAFKRLFGENGQVGKVMKSQNEFAYRHAYSRNRPPVIFLATTKMPRFILRTLTLMKAVRGFLVREIRMDSKNNQSGQSTIEFILTFAFGVSFIFVIFNSAMNYATGYIVHYATFMASRTYLTADSHIGIIGDSIQSMTGAEQKAREVFNNYNLNIFKIDSSNFTINPAGNTSPETYLTVGGHTSFDLTMDVLGRVAGQKKLELVSEAFLGKEVTRAECATRTCFAITGTTSCSATMDITLFDDGC